MPMSSKPALAGVVAAATLLTLAGPADAVTPAADSSRSAGTAAITAGVDVDDYHTDARYAKFYGQKLEWTPCTEAKLKGTHVCATALTPRDWHDPARGEIKLALSRPLGADGKPIDGGRLLFSNPGGPGGLGRGFTRAIANVLDLTKTHTPVDMDPRGVGGSTPLDCPDGTMDVSGGDGDSRGATREQVERARQGAQKWINECRAKNADLLPYLTTDQTARDFNLVRVLMGKSSVDYIGFSYGTWLGAYYAKAFPASTDRVVLDANADWQHPFERLLTGWPAAWQQFYDQVTLPWFARHDADFGLGKTAAEVNTTIEGLRTAAGAKKLGDITPDMVDLYAQGEATPARLSEAGNTMRTLKQALAGDQHAVAALPGLARDGKESLTGYWPAMFVTVVCNDSRAENNPRRWFDRMSTVMGKLPVTSYVGMQAELCAGWPTPPALPQKVLRRPLDALVVNNEMDARTPYPGFLSAIGSVKGSITPVFVDNGVGHGSVYNPNAGKLEATYLTKGDRPSAAVSVPGIPLPKETTVYSYAETSTPKVPLPEEFTYTSRAIVDPKPVVGQTPAPVVQDSKAEALKTVREFIEGPSSFGHR